ncbi:hypothetical protein HDV00_010676 [Rhizophlyctis rosea]|nr:hypothetical protein HDV00_010676 [Rhizophlyctis rosea]
MWLKGVTSVRSEWIAGVAPGALCRMGKVMEMPEPRYDGGMDCVVGYVTPSFGPKEWELPVREVVVGGKVGGWAWFARGIIEGTVFDGVGNGRKGEEENVLKLLLPYVVTKSNTLVKAWGKTQPKVVNLLHALSKADVATRAQLLDKWRTTPTFLLAEYLPWLPADFHALLKKHWPPVEVARSAGKQPSVSFKAGLVKGIKALTKQGTVKKAGGSNSGWGGEVSDEDSDY